MSRRQNRIPALESDPRQDRLQAQKPPENPHSSEHPPIPRGNPRPDQDEADTPTIQELFDPLAYCPPERRRQFEPAAREASKGRYIKAVKLKCMDCSGWEYREARDCAVHKCALWLLNRRIFARTRARKEAA